MRLMFLFEEFFRRIFELWVVGLGWNFVFVLLYFKVVDLFFGLKFIIVFRFCLVKINGEND